MPLPASVTLVPIHGKILRTDANGTPAIGSVAFVPPQALRDTTGNVVLGPTRYTVALDAGGEFTISLPATDDPDITPSVIGLSGIGFYGSAPGAKPTVTGSRDGNAALASLLSALSGLGLITDSTTA